MAIKKIVVRRDAGTFLGSFTSFLFSEITSATQQEWKKIKMKLTEEKIILYR
jgi:hypothetical protein